VKEKENKEREPVGIFYLAGCGFNPRHFFFSGVCVDLCVSLAPSIVEMVTDM
jgi:hypothetical protein